VSRFGLIEKYIDKQGHGVEIGPSYNPLAPKKAGYAVDIIDHADKPVLLEKFRGLGVDNASLARIEEVDFVWHGEKYSALTGHVGYYDWVIASHVVEHTPDFISFINECHEILNDRGVIILAVPDATHCFDYFRQLSSISRIIDAHVHGTKYHTAGTAVDHLLNFCTMDNSIVWNTISGGSLEFMNSASAARRLLEQPEAGTYLDYHAWCFTPSSFRVLIEDLYNLGLISVREVAFIPVDRSEFFVVLGGRGEGPKQSRLQLMKKMKHEIAQETTVMERLYFKLSRLWSCLVKKT
jgi:methyltransferase family protein